MADPVGFDRLCRETLQASPFGVLVHDAEGKISLFTPRLEQITGYAASGVPDIPTWLRLIHPDAKYRKSLPAEPGEEAADGAARVRVSMITRRDGSTEWCRFTSVRRPSGLRVVFVEPVEAPAAPGAPPIENAAHYRFLFQNSPLGLAVTTFDEGRYLEANRAESFMTGYAREELIGRTALELGFYDNPDDSRNIRGLLDQCGTLNNYKFRLRRKSGEIRWGLISANLIEFDGRKCLFSTVSDITDLHQAELALKLSEERLRMATEGATIGWWDWDIKSGAVVCNDIYYTMLGYAPQEFPLSYEKWLELLFPEDRKSLLPRLNRVLAGTLPTFSAEFRIKCRNGSWRWIHGIGRVSARDADGEAVRAIGIHADINARKVAVERLLQANQALEERVQQRTAALEEVNASLRSENSARRAVEDELRARTEELAEINNALRVVLRKSRQESEENARKIIASIRELAFPHLEKLKRAGLAGRKAAHLQLLEEALSGIASSESSTLSELRRKLTPSEYQVAVLIRLGQTSKQLSETMSLSCRTIETHRKSIRKKLGLQHSKTNLCSHLAAMDHTDRP